MSGSTTTWSLVLVLVAITGAGLAPRHAFAQC